VCVCVCVCVGVTGQVLPKATLLQQCIRLGINFGCYVNLDTDLVEEGVLQRRAPFGPVKPVRQRAVKSEGKVQIKKELAVKKEPRAPRGPSKPRKPRATAQERRLVAHAPRGPPPADDNATRAHFCEFLATMKNVEALDRFHLFWRSLSSAQFAHFHGQWPVLHEAMRCVMLLRGPADGGGAEGDGPAGALAVSRRPYVFPEDDRTAKMVDLVDMVQVFSPEQFRRFHTLWASISFAQYETNVAGWCVNYPLIRTAITLYDDGHMPALEGHPALPGLPELASLPPPSSPQPSSSSSSSGSSAPPLAIEAPTSCPDLPSLPSLPMASDSR
jgi:hypothetical protein